MTVYLSCLLICVATACFGFLIGFQLAHIYYCRKMIVLAKRCINTGTIAPVLFEIEK
ncbi:MAG: hypothetical protein U9N40_01120 [Euryarchaeota archaeon]|nr:hypothetical protein [Euryarchaeota archaeon]